jgi:hypothetical protein
MAPPAKSGGRWCGGIGGADAHGATPAGGAFEVQRLTGRGRPPAEHAHDRTVTRASDGRRIPGGLPGDLFDSEEQVFHDG